MKKVQRMLNFHTYKRLFCANFYVIAFILELSMVGSLMATGACYFILFFICSMSMGCIHAS